MFSHSLIGAAQGGSSGKALWLLLACVLVVGCFVALFYYQEWKVTRVYKRRPTSHEPAKDSDRTAGISLAEERQRQQEKTDKAGLQESNDSTPGAYPH